MKPSRSLAFVRHLLTAALVFFFFFGLTVSARAESQHAKSVPPGSRVSFQAVGEFPGIQSPLAMELSGNRAYVLDSQGLSIFDLSKPDQPTLLGSAPASGRLLALGDGVALVGAPSAIEVVDIRTASHPTNVARHTVGMQFGLEIETRSLGGISMDGRTAFLGFAGGGLMVYDLSNPENLNFRGGLPIDGIPGLMGFHGGGITALHDEYVVITKTGFVGPSRIPKSLDEVLLLPRESILSWQPYPFPGQRWFGIKGWLAGREGDMKPRKPVGLGQYLLVPAGALGLLIFDLKSNLPAKQYFPTGPAIDLCIDNSRAFLACEYGGVNVVDVSQPEAPRSLGSHTLKTAVTAVRARGDFVYALAGSLGLQILRMTPNNSPLKEQTITWSTPLEIVETPRVPLVATSSSGLPILFKVLSSDPIQVEINEERQPENSVTGPLIPILKVPPSWGCLAYGETTRLNRPPIIVEILVSQAGNHEYHPAEIRCKVTLYFATRIAIEPDPKNPAQGVLVQIPTAEADCYIWAEVGGFWFETKPSYGIEGSTNLRDWFSLSPTRYQAGSPPVPVTIPSDGAPYFLRLVKLLSN